MPGGPTLYVKSEKIFITQYSEGVPGHPCTGANRTSEIVRNYNQQDQQAIDLLEKEGIPYRLVDLSNCSLTFNLKAKITRINETPTLVVKSKKIRGVQHITKALHETKTNSSNQT